ncbi:MAG: ATPase, T2SS/T4P/T4SS family [Phycisphaerales bacterium]
MTSFSLAVTADPMTLVSYWKPIVLMIPFVLWAWYVSRILDKHAARFILPREKFNAIHLFVALGAMLLAFMMPISGIGGFLAAFGMLVVVFLADILTFINIHNKDERTPEKFRINFIESIIKPPADAEAKKKAKAAKALAGKVEYAIKSPDKSLVTVPDPESPEFQTRLASEALLQKMLVQRATQLELSPTGKDNSYRPAFLIDGITTQGDPMPGADAQKVIDFWKTAAKLDLNERRKKLQAEVAIEKEELKRKLRVTSIGTQAGQRLTLLIDPDKAVVRGVNEMGLLDAQKAEFETFTKSSGGIILLASPPDGGRTTTFYTIIRMHDAYTSNVQTLEMDPQAALEGVKQNKFDQYAEGPEYSTTVRSLLRRDPDVLGVAELPDANTAKEAAKADLERARLYVCVKADNALQALQGWAKLVGEPDLAAKGLKVVVAQKLLRKLCNNCKAEYAPTPDMLKKLGLPEGGVKKLYKKGGQVMVKDKVQTCPACDGGGYFGQEGIFEVIVLTDGDRQMIKAGDWNGLKLELRKRKIPTLQQAALRKAVDGITSVEEVIRVTTETAPAAAAPAAAPAAPAAAPAAKPAAAAPAKK